LRFHYDNRSGAISESLDCSLAHSKILALGYIIRDIILGFCTKASLECELSRTGLASKLFPAPLFRQSGLASSFGFGSAFCGSRPAFGLT